MKNYLDKLFSITKIKYNVSLLCIFLLALVVRIGVASTFVGLSSPPDLEGQMDQQYYEPIAYNLSLGNGYTTSSADPAPTAIVVPGASLTLLPIYMLWGRSFIMGRLWFCFLSALTCLGVALVVQQIADRTAALFAAMIMAFYPNHFYYAIHFTTETPYTFYMAAALACTVATLRKQSPMLNVLAGCFWGAAALTRAQIVLLIPIGFLFVLGAWRSKSNRIFLRTWAIQSLIMMLMLSPWLIRNKLLFGHSALSTYSGHTLLQSHNELIFNDPAYQKDQGSWIGMDKLKELYPITGETLFERDQIARQYALQSIRHNLDKMPGLIWAKFVKFITPLHDTSNYPVKIAFAGGWLFVGIFSLVGFWDIRKYDWPITIAIALPILATLATCLLFHAEARYRDSASPAFVVFAAIGVKDCMLFGISKLCITH